MPLIALAAIALVALLYQQHRHDRQIRDLLAASDTERDKLLRRIQKPEAADIPEIDTTNAAVHFDSDDEYWRAAEESYRKWELSA